VNDNGSFKGRTVTQDRRTRARLHGICEPATPDHVGKSSDPGRAGPGIAATRDGANTGAAAVDLMSPVLPVNCA